MTEEEKAYQACRNPEMLMSRDDAGRTLLHLAAQGGKAAICRLYLNAGIDPSSLDNAGRTAADLARNAGYLSLSRQLDKAIADGRPRLGGLEAVEGDHLLDVREQRALISGDADILPGLIAARRLNSRNAKGDTPLHLAAAGGHLLLCSQLFEAGSDTRIRNDNGHTPADMASEAGHLQLAELLRDLGRRANAPGNELHDAATDERIDCTLKVDPEIEGELAELAFDAEEDPDKFHARQDIATVSATFTPILGGSSLRQGETEEVDWELPASLLRGRGADQFADRLPGDLVNSNHRQPDFSSSNARTRRRARKLASTCFSLDEQTCRRWVQDVLIKEEASDQAIGNLVGECRGDHIADELAANIRRVLEVAGFRDSEAPDPYIKIPTYAAIDVDEDELVEAIDAACNRNASVPGRNAFVLDRSTEERLVREISNTRHELLNAILDNSPYLSAILVCAEKVLAGDVAPDWFCDLQIEVSEESDVDATFVANLATLRETAQAGYPVSGRTRRKAIEALEDLELTRPCLISLAREVGEETEDRIRQLLDACDRSTERFILTHLPFARRETSKMALPHEDTEELFQEAYFAVRRAAERFDPDRGVRFYVYALYWIRQQISRWRMDNMSLIRLPVHRHELHKKIELFREDFEYEYLRLPTYEEISEHFQFSVGSIKSIDLALSTPVEFHQEMSEAADFSASPEELATMRQADMLVRLELEQLDERQGEILRMRFGIDRDDDMTLEEVGQIYGVTRERIRQIEAKALTKLAHPTRARFLRELL